MTYAFIGIISLLGTAAIIFHTAWTDAEFRVAELINTPYRPPTMQGQRAATDGVEPTPPDAPPSVAPQPKDEQ